jgi:pimeloyl-ACP methyl ester carboxylesterase
MPLIHHHTVSGDPIADVRRTPLVFIHGFGCDHTDWAAQVADLAPSHPTVAVDLRGHGSSPGDAADCSIERYGADVAAVMRALALPPAVLVGHSLGCRVAAEAALQAPEHTAAVVLVDGSQFAAAMGPALRAAFAQPDGYARMTETMFRDMFGPGADPAMVARVVARAGRLPRLVGEKMMLDLQRYDVTRWTAALGCLRVPVLAIQSTWTNDRRERQPLRPGQTTPYLDMLRSAVPGARIEIVPDTGHFPQLEQPVQTNALLAGFLAA